MPTDPAVLSATMVELADTLVSEYDLLDHLERLLERSAEALAAEAGGVICTDRSRVSVRAKSTSTAVSFP